MYLTVDQVIDHLFFIEKVQKGLADSENGLVKNKDESKQLLSKWLKQLGLFQLLKIKKMAS